MYSYTLSLYRGLGKPEKKINLRAESIDEAVREAERVIGNRTQKGWPRIRREYKNGNSGEWYYLEEVPMEFN